MKKFLLVTFFYVLLATYYVLFPSSIFAATDTTYFIHQDHLGSVIAVSDEEGNLVSQTKYAPYGNTSEESHSTSLQGHLGGERGYTGQIFDQNTALQYYNARYYDPILSRFISADSVNDQQNRFGYVNGNPIMRNDPSGQVGICIQYSRDENGEIQTRRLTSDACGELTPEQREESSKIYQEIKERQDASFEQRSKNAVGYAANLIPFVGGLLSDAAGMDPVTKEQAALDMGLIGMVQVIQPQQLPIGVGRASLNQKVMMLPKEKVLAMLQEYQTGADIAAKRTSIKAYVVWVREAAEKVFGYPGEDMARLHQGLVKEARDWSSLLELDKDLSQYAAMSPEELGKMLEKSSEVFIRLTQRSVIKK